MGMGGCFSAAALAAVALGAGVEGVALGAGPGERGSVLAPFAGDLLGLCFGLAAGLFKVETTAILVSKEIAICLSYQWLPPKKGKITK